jgi:hypothetical protein
MKTHELYDLDHDGRSRMTFWQIVLMKFGFFGLLQAAINPVFNFLKAYTEELVRTPYGHVPFNFPMPMGGGH